MDVKRTTYTEVVASARRITTARRWPDKGTYVVAALILTVGAYVIYPVALMIGLSFNTATLFFVGERDWGFDHWRIAFSEPRIPLALWNTIWLWGVSTAVSFPLGILVAWLLARTRLPGSHLLEVGYWIAYVTPGGFIAWIMLLDPTTGMANRLLELLPFVDRGPFNIFSIPGIIFVNVVGGASSSMVMILTPVFRNMDAALEEAARIAGASKLRTMMRVTIPVMVSPIVLIFTLQLLRIFSGFERELILGRPIGFEIYSTLIYELTRLQDPPAYGQATALASMTIVVIAFIVPLQRWILTRRRYTTVTGSFKRGLIELGGWKWVAFFLVLGDHLVNVFTFGVLILGSFMTRIGYFMLDPPFSTANWQWLFQQSDFYIGLQTTLILAFAGGIFSPLLFATLAYIIVRTKWRFRGVLDGLIWLSGAIPGVLLGLGMMFMFLWTPGLSFLYGTIWVLILVVIMSGSTTGVNLFKGYIVNIGEDLEEAARVSGAGWFRAFFTIWIPLLGPYLALIGLFNFNQAANTTSSIILLANRDTITLSILQVFYLLEGGSRFYAASAAIQIIIGAITLFTALAARHYAIRVGVRHR